MQVNVPNIDKRGQWPFLIWFKKDYHLHKLDVFINWKKVLISSVNEKDSTIETNIWTKSIYDIENYTYTC